MKVFTNMYQIEEFYFSLTTKKEYEKEFMKTATPKEIGEYFGKQTMDKVKKRIS